MDQGGNPDLEAQLAAALDWWRDAGVDMDFHDEPTGWLAEPPASEPRLREGGSLVPQADARRDERGLQPRGDANISRDAAPAVQGIDPASLPRDLAAFAEWWTTEPLLDNGRVAGRVPPRGKAGARLMVLVAEPEAEDSGILLSGRQGKLLEAMLSAMGIAQDDAYVASALPRHMPHPDWAGIAAQGLGKVLAHHIHLAAPRGILVFGANILPLIGHDPTLSADNSSGFNHEGSTVPLLAERGLGFLLEMPRRKAKFWQRWLDWSGRV